MTTQPFTARVTGTVNVDERDYDYTAIVTMAVAKQSQWHPYGMGTALEVWCERQAEDVDIVEIVPDSELRRVHICIEEDAREKAEAL